MPTGCFYFCHSDEGKMSPGSWSRDESIVLWTSSVRVPRDSSWKGPAEAWWWASPGQFLPRLWFSILFYFKSFLSGEHSGSGESRDPLVLVEFSVHEWQSVIPRTVVQDVQINAELLANLNQSLKTVTKCCILYLPCSPKDPPDSSSWPFPCNDKDTSQVMLLVLETHFGIAGLHVCDISLSVYL